MDTRTEKPREIPSNLWECLDKSAQRLFFDAVESTYDRDANRQQQFLPAHVVLAVIGSPGKHLQVYIELVQRTKSALKPAALRSDILSSVGSGMTITERPVIPEETRSFLTSLTDQHLALSLRHHGRQLSDRDVVLAALEAECKALGRFTGNARYHLPLSRG